VIVHSAGGTVRASNGSKAGGSSVKNVLGKFI